MGKMQQTKIDAASYIFSPNDTFLNRTAEKTSEKTIQPTKPLASYIAFTILTQVLLQNRKCRKLTAPFRYLFIHQCASFTELLRKKSHFQSSMRRFH